MGLHKNYLRVSQNAGNQLFGLPHVANHQSNGPTPLSMLISQGGKFNSSRIAVIMIGVCTLIAGVVLASVPWLNYFLLKNLRLWNGTLSFHYWQRPGVIRLTKVYIFNVTNPEGFLNGEKPKLVEVGPFVYREDMEKVNIKFHDNYTVSYQHKKILHFVPELSVDKNLKIVTPNIPLLTLSTLSNSLSFFLAKTISLVLTAAKYQPFVSLTAEELVFGYDDTLVTLAHKFYPRNKRPMSKMGLLVARNGTLTEVHTIHTGHSGMDKFGYLDKLNGIDHLPYWEKSPCRNMTASEGSFFPPRDVTGADVVWAYDKDLCRRIPFRYQKPIVKDGINADLFVMDEFAYGGNNSDNQCFNPPDYQAVHGLQNLTPCQYGAPVYVSQPHFYQTDPSLIAQVEGLSPQREIHESYFKIQPQIGVPLEGKVRAQLNLKVDHAPQIESVKNFRSFVFPIMWLEEGVSEMSPEIRRWIYLATMFAPLAGPILSYLFIVSGALMIVCMLFRAYQSFVFPADPAHELLEVGRRSLRRGSTLVHNQHHRMLVHHRDSYQLLRNLSTTSNQDSTVA